MTDGKSEGGVIRKEIKRIFQRVREIIDENQKKNRAPNANESRHLKDITRKQTKRKPQGFALCSLQVKFARTE